MDIKTIGVVGAGTMGNGIAQVFSQAGFSVLLHDASLPALDRARTSIEKSLAKFVEKGKLTAEARDAALGRLSPVLMIDALAAADYVVEAIIENPDVKRELLSRLDAITQPEVIITSNTSSISITFLGATTARPDKVLGMHFMNPVPLMTLVELVRGQATSDASMQVATDLCKTLGKTAVEAADAERQVEGEGPGGDRLDRHAGPLAQTHDRTLAELLLDLADRHFDSLATFLVLTIVAVGLLGTVWCCCHGTPQRRASDWGDARWTEWDSRCVPSGCQAKIVAHLSVSFSSPIAYGRWRLSPLLPAWQKLRSSSPVTWQFSQGPVTDEVSAGVSSGRSRARSCVPGSRRPPYA